LVSQGHSGNIVIGENSRIDSAACLGYYRATGPVGSRPGVNVTIRRTNLAQAENAIIEIGDDSWTAMFLPMTDSKPVTICDNVWVGFDSVITGRVEIGRGAIFGCKTLLTENITPYAVVVGNPGRILRFLEPDDTEEARTTALQKFGISPPVTPV